MKIEERNKKFYTEKGIEAMKVKLKTSVEFYNKDVFPISQVMLGFGMWRVETKEELMGRIKELAQLTGSQIKEETIVEKGTDGQTIKRGVIIIS